MSLIKRLLIVCLLLLMFMIMTFGQSAVHAQNVRPFSLPFTTPPGPGTWLIGQQYGNTVEAYNYGKYWYILGQGIHFGLDFLAPCGTPILAIADGVVDEVDNPQHGALPHNLMIRHQALGYVSLYGHLYIKPTLTVGQEVKRGDVIAQTGDPDETCVSRPHLHLEIRSLDYLTAYDPAQLIDADWSMLSSIGYEAYNAFAKDLYDPNNWQTIDQQPDTKFGSNMINKFRAVWPPSARVAPPPQTLEAMTLPPIPANADPSFRKLTESECCSQPWWSGDGKMLNFWDGPSGQFATVMSIGVEPDSKVQIFPSAPSRLLSADGKYEVQWDPEHVYVIHLGDNTPYPIDTGGAWPQFSPDSTHLLWRYLPKDDVPGLAPPITQIWISNVDGTGRKLIKYQSGGGAYWLDDDRILFMTREGQTNISALSIYTISTGEVEPLTTETNINGLSISPGGHYIMYYLTFQQDSGLNGIHLMQTRPNAPKPLLPFFGSWRWRDSHSVIYIPYAPGKPMSFQLYNIDTGETHALTTPAKQPFTIINDDWSISPDGQHLEFWGNSDEALWMVTLPTS